MNERIKAWQRVTTLDKNSLHIWFYLWLFPRNHYHTSFHTHTQTVREKSSTHHRHISTHLLSLSLIVKLSQLYLLFVTFYVTALYICSKIYTPPLCSFTDAHLILQLLTTWPKATSLVTIARFFLPMFIDLWMPAYSEQNSLASKVASQHQWR